MWLLAFPSDSVVFSDSAVFSQLYSKEAHFPASLPLIIYSFLKSHLTISRADIWISVTGHAHVIDLTIVLADIQSNILYYHLYE